MIRKPWLRIRAGKLKYFMKERKTQLASWTFKMEDFYRNWLVKFREKTKPFVQQQGGDESSSDENEDNVTQQALKEPSEIIYENNSLKLIVEKGSFRRQKVFRLQDHLFKFKIVQKNPHDELPILTDLFDFLHAALVHVLESIKSFYNADDHNVAYLTLHQDPMVNGLNTGKHEQKMIS